VTAVTNLAPVWSDQAFRERFEIMLLSSILQILDRHQAQRNTAEKTKIMPFDIELASASEATAAEKASSPKESESDGAATAELLKPNISQRAPPVSVQNLEYFMRAITIFEKPEQRVVDVFE
jgi:hypothetical protein